VGIDHLRRRLGQVDGDILRGGVRKVQRIGAAARLVNGVAAQGGVCIEAIHVSARAAGQLVIQRVAGETVVEHAADGILDRVVGGQVQVQVRIDDLAGCIRYVQRDCLRGGGREVQRIGAAAGLIDGVGAQGVVGIEEVGIIAGGAGQAVVARPAGEAV